MPLEFVACWAFMELAFLAPAAILPALRKRKHKRCTRKTMGTLIGYKSTGTDSYYPVIGFDVDDVHYQEETNISSTLFIKKHSIGDAIAVHYNPDRPEEMYLPEQDNTAYLLSGIFVFIALMLFAIFFGLAIANFK